MAVTITRAAIPSHTPQAVSGRIDLSGAVLLALVIVALIAGLSQSQSWSWSSRAVWALLAAAVIAGAAFVAVERRHSQPLVDLGLFRKSPNYRIAVISQSMAPLIFIAPLIGAMTSLPPRAPASNLNISICCLAHT